MKIQKLSLSLAAIILSGFGWYFFAAIFNTSKPLAESGLNWILFFISLALSFAFLFAVSLTKDRFDFTITTLLSSVWILAFLGPSLKTFFCAAIMFATSQILWSFPTALERSLAIKYYTVSFGKITLVILALIGISSAYLQTRLVESIQRDTFTQNASNYAWPYVGKYLSRFNSSQDVNGYLKEQFKSQGINNPSSAMLEQEKKNISQDVGFEVKGNEKMSDLGKKFVSYKLNDLIKQFNLDRASLLLIFFSLLSLLPISSVIFAVFAKLLYLVLRKMGVLKVTEGQILTKKLEF
ncbi:MAG: hypothetical protein NVS3B9_4720 [Candidatus Doudnabacteria bacterium]